LAPNIIIRRLVPTTACSLDHTVTKTSSHDDRDDIGVLEKIDAIGEQEAQRRLRQRIEILGRELAIAHDNGIAVGDDVDRARRIVFEPDLARLLDIELALGAAPSGPTWTKSPTSCACWYR
jgi:hypothetical protein